MKCEACGEEKQERENPKEIFNLLSYAHTCNHPKREDFLNSLIDSQKKIWDAVDIDIKFTEEDYEKGKMQYSERDGKK
jgi:hypothetical protein